MSGYNYETMVGDMRREDALQEAIQTRMAELIDIIGLADYLEMDDTEIAFIATLQIHDEAEAAAFDVLAGYDR